jgi:predicted kinase
MSAKRTILLLAGLPGTGKTTIGLELARRLGWVSIDKDTLKSRLLASGVGEATAGPTSYDLMEALPEDLVMRQGKSVILDSPGVYSRTLAFASELARNAGADLKIIVLLAERELRNRRAEERKSMASQPRPPREQDEDDGRSRFLHLPANRLELNTDAPLDELIESALEHLAARP